MVHLTRRYRFSAAHRLHNDSLSARENARIYGKCNNPFGHGHNYVLEVTVGGSVDPSTGMVVDMGFLDAVVNHEVIERFDEVHLNLDTEAFRRVVPTTENLCVEIYRSLKERLTDPAAAPQAVLERVGLEETSSNFFEYLRIGDG
ncbi:MAG: 6-carboxytetrahydropterin synthase [Terriglobia bacterium]